MANGGLGKVRNPWGVIGLSLITLGIYFIYWQYITYKELKDDANDGIGGGLGLVFAIFIPIVNSFLLPSEVGHVYQRQGKTPPVTGLTGFWTFIPIVGFFIWTIKVQGRLNEFWESGGLGAVGAAPPPFAPTGAPPQAPLPPEADAGLTPPPSGDVPPPPPGQAPPPE
jgi:drug/metabolite transporter (DMT)-like permease